MALKTWIGGDNTHSTAGNYRGASAPAADDEVVYTGAISIDGAATGLTLDSITFHADWSGSAGSSGTRLTYVDVENVRFQSTKGKAFIESTTVFGSVYVNAKNGRSDMLTLDGIVTKLVIADTSGTIELVSGCDIDEIYIWNSPGVTVNLRSASTVGYLEADSGLFYSESSIVDGTSQVKLSGTARLQVSDSHAASFDTVEIKGQRAIMDDRGSGSINTKLYVTGGGTYTLRRNPGYAKTIADAWRGPGGRIDLGTVGQSVTLTAGILELDGNNTDFGRRIAYSGN